MKTEYNTYSLVFANDEYNSTVFIVTKKNGAELYVCTPVNDLQSVS